MQYQVWVEEGKHGVVRKALQSIAKKASVPHQLYLTFDTRISGVQMAKTLKTQYPEEMTILLNDQFWNLKIKEDLFSVELVFDDQQHLIVVPFCALRTFIDSDAKFALQFNPECFNIPLETEQNVEQNTRVIILDRFRKNDVETPKRT